MTQLKFCILLMYTVYVLDDDINRPELKCDRAISRTSLSILPIHLEQLKGVDRKDVHLELRRLVEYTANGNDPYVFFL